MKRPNFVEPRFELFVCGDFVEKIAFDKLHFVRLPHDRVEVVARQRVADHSAPRCAISPPLGRQAYYGRGLHATYEPGILKQVAAAGHAS